MVKRNKAHDLQTDKGKIRVLKQFSQNDLEINIVTDRKDK